MLKLLSALVTSVLLLNWSSTAALAFDDPVLNHLAEIGNTASATNSSPPTVPTLPDLPSAPTTPRSSNGAAPGSWLVSHMHSAIGGPVKVAKAGGSMVWSGAQQLLKAPFSTSPVTKQSNLSQPVSSQSNGFGGSNAGGISPYSQSTASSSPAYQPATSFYSTPNPIGYSQPAYLPISFGEGYGWTNPNVVPVSGYFRKNGTYVAPYLRTARNSTMRDNFSTKRNTNPYTGTRGTRRAWH